MGTGRVQSSRTIGWFSTVENDEQLVNKKFAPETGGKRAWVTDKMYHLDVALVHHGLLGDQV